MEQTYSKGLRGLLVKKKEKEKEKTASGLETAAELLGDRWTLLILRALVLSGPGSFKNLLKKGEGIATNVLADRLRKLRAWRIIQVERQRADHRKRIYSVTSKGAALRPILREMALWASNLVPERTLRTRAQLTSGKF